MGYGRHCPNEDFPWNGTDEDHFQYGYREADSIWERMVERATIGSEIVALTGEEPKRAEPEGTPISNTLRHLLYCDYWDDYRSEAYLKGICKKIEERIREEIKNETFC